MLVDCQSHLIEKKLFPEHIDSFRLNSISRKDWRDFVNHPDAIALVSLEGDITVKKLFLIKLAQFYFCAIPHANTLTLYFMNASSIN